MLCRPDQEDPMEIRMDGRVAVITGASTGLGLAMAREFVAAGASVAMLARRQDVLDAAASDVRGLAAQGARVAAIACDVAKSEPIAAAWERIEAELGAVDILVNNAGVSAARPFEASSDADWQADLDLKLFAAIRLTRLALPGMRARRWGRIVNVLNTGAKAPAANSTPTSVSRAAGLALTKALAQENAPHGILVNAMLVGLIESDQWRRRHAAGAGDGGDYADFLAGMAKGRVPLGRVGEAAEFARLACFLCSDAGSFVTGTAINVDGGMCPVP
jgi:NAD(P)-dependent dehydrogenase (short-subunit alcohol dehydrogenase family)